MNSKIEKAIRRYIKESDNEKKEEYAKILADCLDDAIYCPNIQELSVDDIVYILSFTEITIYTALELIDKFPYDDCYKIICACHFSEEVSLDDSFHFLNSIKDNGIFSPLRKLFKEYELSREKFEELALENEKLKIEISELKEQNKLLQEKYLRDYKLA